MSAQPPPTSAENAFAADLFQGLPPRYDLLAEVLSFGQNGRWRDELVARIVRSSAGRILDVATGTAGVAIQLARQTEAHVAGIDISEAMLGRGREHVRAAGGVCIADEVQSGFGRTGTHYWGFETQGVIPDIVCMAKGIGNGCPLGAVVTTPKIAAALSQRIHFNTFGGNPVVSAQGKAVLEVIDREKLQANSLAMGNHLAAGLRRLKEKHNVIGDARGKGLMLGIELVKDRATKEPANSAS